MVKRFNEYFQIKEQTAAGGAQANPQVSAAQTQLDELARQQKQKEAELVQIENKMAALISATFTNLKVKIEPSGKI